MSFCSKGGGLKFIYIFFISYFLFVKILFSQVIYGNDNRKWFEPNTFNYGTELNANATAAIINKYSLVYTRLINGSDSIIMAGAKYPPYDPQFYAFPENKVSSHFQTNLCSFSSQYSSANVQAISNCSSLLIDEDKILTAGHCIDQVSSCGLNGSGNERFIFNFYKDSLKAVNLAETKVENFYTPKNTDVYSCTKVLRYIFNYDANGLLPLNSIEYAIVKLDRNVSGRYPHRINFSNKVSPLNLYNEQSELYALGFPLGYPLNLIDGASVRSGSSTYLKTNIDSFKGTSGGGVFTENNNLLIGIISQIPRVRFLYDFSKACFNTHQCNGGFECNNMTGVVPLNVILDDLKRHNNQLWYELCRKSKQFYSSQNIACE